MTDELIVEQVLRGNTHVFSEIVNRYKDKVFGMVYRFTNDYAEAQDLSQEVFITVFKNLHLFGEKAKFSTWLYRVGYNLCIDWTRKNKKRRKEAYVQDECLEMADEMYNLEDSIINSYKQKAVRKEINSLAEKYKTVIILYHYQGLSYEEIGEVLKVPVKTVESRLYRSRKLLKKSLEKYRYGGESFEMQSGGEVNGQIS